MLTGPVPGLPPHQVWAQISDPQKIEYLYRAVEQIWGSLSITGQQLTARFDALERRTRMIWKNSLNEWRPWRRLTGRKVD
jgi:hypothetical protein